MSREAGFRFVHLTDTHIMAGGAWRTRSGFTFDTEESAVSRLMWKFEERPSGVLVNGSP
jgi:hypothetical protein